MPELPDSYNPPPDHDARLAQARRRAGWELGSKDWADIIIRAYMYPQQDRERLQEEMDS